METQDLHTVRRDSAAWLFFVRVSFVVALVANSLGVAYLPVDPWVRAYLGIGELFLVGSTITMAKALRDEHEAKTLLSRITEARTSKLLREFEPS
jgi:hypothetical protein